MIWIILLSIIGILVALALILNVLGRFLPQTYAAQLDATIDRPVEDVWNAILDYQSNPVTGRYRRSSQPLPSEDGKPSWIEDIGQSIITVTTEEVRESEFVRRRYSDSVVPMTAVAELELEALPEGCKLRCSNETTIVNGTWHVPYFRCMMFMFGGVRKGLRQYMRTLAKNLQTKAEFLRS